MIKKVIAVFLFICQTLFLVSCAVHTTDIVSDTDINESDSGISSAASVSGVAGKEIHVEEASWGMNDLGDEKHHSIFSLELKIKKGELDASENIGTDDYGYRFIFNVNVSGEKLKLDLTPFTTLTKEDASYIYYVFDTIGGGWYEYTNEETYVINLEIYKNNDYYGSARFGVDFDDDDPFILIKWLQNLYLLSFESTEQEFCKIYYNDKIHVNGIMIDYPDYSEIYVVGNWMYGYAHDDWSYTKLSLVLSILKDELDASENIGTDKYEYTFLFEIEDKSGKVKKLKLTPFKTYEVNEDELFYYFDIISAGWYDFTVGEDYDVTLIILKDEKINNIGMFGFGFNENDAEQLLDWKEEVSSLDLAAREKYYKEIDIDKITVNNYTPEK